MNIELKGRKAIVTGSTAGIGRATFVQDLSEVSVALLDEISQRLSKLSSKEEEYSDG